MSLSQLGERLKGPGLSRSWRIGVLLDGLAGVGGLLGLLVSASSSAVGGAQVASQVHLVAPWMGFLALIVALATAVLYLWRREARYDAWSGGSVEVGFALVSISVLTGIVSTRWTQSLRWEWRPSLAVLASLWLICLAYISLHSVADDPQRGARLAAVYAVSALATAPLLFLSFNWWQAGRPATEQLRPAALQPLLLWGAVFGLLYGAVIRHRLRLASLSRLVSRLRDQVAAGDSGSEHRC